MNVIVLNRLLSACFCMALISMSALAQVSVNASGGKAMGVGGSQSYSVGQLVYSSMSDGSKTILQGAQQVYIISTVTEIANAKDINLSVLAYPNPVKDNLKLIVNSEKYFLPSLQVKIVDISGKTLGIKNFSSPDLQIDMSQFPPATYFLIILQNNNELKTFKVVKN